MSLIDENRPEWEIQEEMKTKGRDTTMARIISRLSTLYSKRHLIPEEFQMLTENGLAMRFYEKKRGNENSYDLEQAGMLLTDTDKPLYTFIEVSVKETIRERGYKFYSFEEFAKKVLPFRGTWIYDAHTRLGVLIPLAIDVPQQILEVIPKVTNQEIRRVLLKRYGLNKLLDPKQKELKILDRWNDYILFDLDIKSERRGDMESFRFLYCKDSSPRKVNGKIIYVDEKKKIPEYRDFILEVPLTEPQWSTKTGEYKIDTCKRAVAWTFEKKESEYAPALEA